MASTSLIHGYSKRWQGRRAPSQANTPASPSPQPTAGAPRPNAAAALAPRHGEVRQGADGSTWQFDARLGRGVRVGSATTAAKPAAPAATVAKSGAPAAPASTGSRVLDAITPRSAGTPLLSAANKPKSATFSSTEKGGPTGMTFAQATGKEPMPSAAAVAAKPAAAAPAPAKPAAPAPSPAPTPAPVAAAPVNKPSPAPAPVLAASKPAAAQPPPVPQRGTVPSTTAQAYGPSGPTDANPLRDALAARAPKPRQPAPAAPSPPPSQELGPSVAATTLRNVAHAGKLMITDPLKTVHNAATDALGAVGSALFNPTLKPQPPVTAAAKPLAPRMQTPAPAPLASTTPKAPEPDRYPGRADTESGLVPRGVGIAESPAMKQSRLQTEAQKKKPLVATQ